MKPLAIDLYCGLGGWSDGLLAEGYDVVGFDIERHVYGDQQYPAQLVIQDVRTLHGNRFRNATVIVASPPCQEFSYMSMPFSRGKQIAAALRGQGEFPAGYTGSRTVAELTSLFDACFRIAHEAGVPLVVENVRGAQPWVGRAPWNYGSYYLWGDVPAIMPHVLRAQKFNPDGTAHPPGSWFAVADSENRGALKVPGMNFHDHKKTGKPGRSFQSAAVKTTGHANISRRTHTHTRHLTNQAESDALKARGDWFGRGENCSPMRMREEDYQKWVGVRGDGTKQPGLSGYAWFDFGASAHPSGSHARKAASAQIAKIPFELAAHIARVYKPRAKEAVA